MAREIDATIRACRVMGVSLWLGYGRFTTNGLFVVYHPTGQRSSSPRTHRRLAPCVEQGDSTKAADQKAYQLIPPSRGVIDLAANRSITREGKQPVPS